MFGTREKGAVAFDRRCPPRRQGGWFSAERGRTEGNLGSYLNFAPQKTRKLALRRSSTGVKPGRGCQVRDSRNCRVLHFRDRQAGSCLSLPTPMFWVDRSRDERLRTPRNGGLRGVDSTMDRQHGRKVAWITVCSVEV